MAQPRTIDESQFSKRMTFDVSAPDGSATGIPTKAIPIMEFPRVVYKHPREPYRKIEHRNAQHEVVHVEMVHAEALSKLVNDEAELKAALAEGWTKDIYLPPPLPDPNAHLYSDSDESWQASEAVQRVQRKQRNA